MKFKVVSKKNPRDLDAPQKYYAQIVRPDSISLEILSKRIAEISPISELDTQSVLIAFTKVLPEYFVQGATIELGDLGYFHCSVRSEGAPSIKDFTAHLIKGFSINYRPSAKVKKQCKSVKYRKVEN